jgi:hypothetical protein
VVTLQSGDAKGLILLRVFVVSDAKPTVNHKTQDERDLLLFGIPLMVDVFLYLAHYFLIRFSKFNHMLEFGFRLLRDEGGVVGVLRAPFGVIAYRQNLGGSITGDLDLVVSRWEIESPDHSFNLGLPYQTLGIGVFIGVAPLGLLHDGPYDVVLHYYIAFKNLICVDIITHMTDSMDSEQPLREYLDTRYHARIMEQLNDATVPLYLREHYTESPNYYATEDPSVMIETLVWLSRTDAQKQAYLQADLEAYMDS